MLRFAKECGDKLIVAVESDRIAASAAHVPQDLRLEGLENNSLVDEAFIFDEPIEAIVARLRPDIIVKGKEHELNYNPEKKAIEKYGGRLIFSSGETIFSSFDLIKKEFNELDSGSIKLPIDFMRRHGITKVNLVDLIYKFSKLKICVVGDLIVDEYITCQPLGMSQEDPTIVLTPIDSTKFIGGAGIVAAHAAGMGAAVNFITVAGRDNAYKFAAKELKACKVNTNFILDEDRPTTLKQRFRSKGQTIMRLSHLHKTAISKNYQKEILSLVKKIINKVDLLVFSDFNYGCLPQSLIEEIISYANLKKILISADSQSSSQAGDIARFKNVDLLTPTEYEARLSTRNYEDGLVVLAEDLKQKTAAKNILLKLGEEGLLIHSESQHSKDWLTDRVDALNNAPKDVAGAGDSLLITSSMTLVSGGNIWEAACLGSIAAAIQVGRVGNTPLKSDELINKLQ
ncbi:MAG: ADP-heptose synthase / D-glycero-beta-D-manno-heptose 7-phosphate kinase [Bacteroidota bacterium]